MLWGKIKSKKKILSTQSIIIATVFFYAPFAWGRFHCTHYNVVVDDREGAANRELLSLVILWCVILKLLHFSLCTIFLLFIETCTLITPNEIEGIFMQREYSIPRIRNTWLQRLNVNNFFFSICMHNIFPLNLTIWKLWVHIFCIVTEKNEQIGILLRSIICIVCYVPCSLFISIKVTTTFAFERKLRMKLNNNDSNYLLFIHKLWVSVIFLLCICRIHFNLLWSFFFFYIFFFILSSVSTLEWRF